MINCNEWRTETAQMRKYGESKTIRIMMATVPHVTSGLGLRKFQADAFFLTRVYHYVFERGSLQKQVHVLGPDDQFMSQHIP